VIRRAWQQGSCRSGPGRRQAAACRVPRIRRRRKSSRVVCAHRTDSLSKSMLGIQGDPSRLAPGVHGLGYLAGVDGRPAAVMRTKHLPEYAEDGGIDVREIAERISRDPVYLDDAILAAVIPLGWQHPRQVLDGTQLDAAIAAVAADAPVPQPPRPDRRRRTARRRRRHAAGRGRACRPAGTSPGQRAPRAAPATRRRCTCRSWPPCSGSAASWTCSTSARWPGATRGPLRRRCRNWPPPGWPPRTGSAATAASTSPAPPESPQDRPGTTPGHPGHRDSNELPATTHEQEGTVPMNSDGIYRRKKTGQSAAGQAGDDGGRHREAVNVVAAAQRGAAFAASLTFAFLGGSLTEWMDGTGVLARVIACLLALGLAALTAPRATARGSLTAGPARDQRNSGDRR